MDYSEQLKHPNWQKRRLEILQRDKFTCQSCGCMEESLNVHHLFYNKDLKIWDYADNELITLCDSCHKEWHRLKKRIDMCMPANLDYMREMANLINDASKLHILTIKKLRLMIL